MQLSTSALFTSLAYGTLAAAEQVNLVAVGPSSEVNGQALYDIHEGAGINYGFLGTTGANYTLDTSKGILYDAQQGSDMPFVAIIDSNQLSFVLGSVEDGTKDKFTISDGFLAVNGSTKGFWGAKYGTISESQDPYGYSKTNYLVGYGNAPDGSVPFSLKIFTANSTTNSTTSSSASGAGATTTVQSTVLTTYCPNPTTFTWGGSTHTVTEPTTLTVTDCGCTEAPSSAPSAAASTEPSSPEVANGGAVAHAGAAAGLAAAAVLLM